MRKILIIIVILVLGGTITALFLRSKSEKSPQKEGPVVATSFYPLYFLASEIMGERGTVYNITPAGAEPHDYELTTRDRINLEKSQLIFINGGLLEPWGKNVISIYGNKKVVSLSDDFIIEGDPHVWLDPVYLMEEAKIVTQKLVEIDPGYAQQYLNNAAFLLKQLELMENDFTIGLGKCEYTDVIVAHSAFSYLARRYGFNQHAITGLSPDEEPSSKSLAEIAKLARQKNIKYIFFESLVSPKLAETVAKEVGAETLVLNPLEGLSDSELALGKNFFTEMKVNLNNLRTALVCQ